MSIHDWSQLSDLSGISRIRSSSIRRSEKADSIINGSEVNAASSIRAPATKEILVDGFTNSTKIVKAIVLCEETISNYNKLELIETLLREAMTNNCSKLQNTVKTKLNDHLVVHRVKKYLKLPNTDKNVHKDLTLLGIIDLPNIQFNHDEKRDIGATVENMLREKINNFIVRYEMLGGSVKDAVKSQDSYGKRCLATNNYGGDLMRWKDQTDEICGEYYRDIMRCADLVYQWQQLKNVEMHELNLKIAEDLLLEAQVAEVQAKITTKTCAIGMFKETPWTVDAFKILSDKVDAKITETREELRKKKALKTTYDDVFTPTYDQVLKKYTELLDLIKKKERLMDML